MATYELLNEISETLNQRKITDGIFCDLSKAFDYVDNIIILTKLEIYGLKCRFFQIYQIIFRGYQKIQISAKNDNNLTSKDWRKTSQGSILGPLLFLININGFPIILENNSISYSFRSRIKYQRR